MTGLKEAGELSTGELLDGRYRLEERIGEGGMARVFRAEDTVLGRTVAVKILRAPVDGLGEIERARSETTLLASLNHHALVTLFDAHVSEEDGSYLVMEYVEGITLLERMAGGPIQPREAASLTIDIAEALHVAHSAGIVHRDIKPSNVLLWKSPIPDREWRAKIADFGIAHLLDSGRVTTPGLMVGTAAYIAPEQARGAEPAPSADIYALGLVLIEAMTGTRPFADAEGIGTVVARLQNPPAVPETLGRGWYQLLRGMTAMLPADRPTALEVVVAASRLLNVTAPIGTDQATAPIVTATAESTAVLPLETAAAAAVGGGLMSAAHVGSGIPSGAPSRPPDTTAVLAAAAPGGSLRRAELSRSRDQRRRRSGIVAGFAFAVLIVASLVGAALWSTSPLAGLEPAPSQPAEQLVIEPEVEENPPAESPPPADDTADNETVDNGNSGPSSDNGNGNSGPGNNNGKGKGKGKNG